MYVYKLYFFSLPPSIEMIILFLFLFLHLFLLVQFFEKTQQSWIVKIENNIHLVFFFDITDLPALFETQEEIHGVENHRLIWCTPLYSRHAIISGENNPKGVGFFSLSCLH